jgi:hypothetical protein
MKLARQGGVGKSSAKAAATTARCIGVGIHFPQKDQRKAKTIMNVVLEIPL